MAHSSNYFNSGSIHPGLEIRAGCWRSNAYHMMQSGWDFELYHEPQFFETYLMMCNRQNDMVARAHLGDPYKYANKFPDILHIPSDAVVEASINRSIQMPVAAWEITPISVGMVDSHARTPAEYIVYTAKKDDGPQEIIITPERIPEVLEQIRKAQEPAARELLHKQRRREERAELKSFQLQAKILSFAS